MNNISKKVKDIIFNHTENVFKEDEVKAVTKTIHSLPPTEAMAVFLHVNKTNVDLLFAVHEGVRDLIVEIVQSTAYIVDDRPESNHLKNPRYSPQVLAACEELKEIKRQYDDDASK